MLHLLKKQIRVPENFAVEARFINKFMNFCSLEVLDTPEPGVSDLVRMLSFTEDVKMFTEEILGVQAENV
jgi:protein-tyrosine phosphatase